MGLWCDSTKKKSRIIVEKRSQIYFQIYQKLEREVLDLSSAFHFVNENLEVYSIDIADLIVRASIELESISKDVASINCGHRINSAGDAFNWLEEHWNLSSKVLKIYSPYFHFNEEVSIFHPFNYNRGDKDDYYSTYNSIKHDRNKNLRKATLYTLIRILGALFIMNVYYRDETLSLKQNFSAQNYDKSGGSEIFNFEIYPYQKILTFSQTDYYNKENCIYEVIKNNSEYAIAVEYKNEFGEIDYFKMANNSEFFQYYLKNQHKKYLDTFETIKFISEIHPNLIDDIKKEVIDKLKIEEIISMRIIEIDEYYYGKLIKENDTE